MKVLNFTYNGFSGNNTGGEAPYTAKFKKWVMDRGVMLCDCSDGKERLIPTFALKLEKGEKEPPKQPEVKVYGEKGEVLCPAAIFGSACHS